MSTDIDITETLDVKGMNCPMPVVKTKQAIDDVPAGGTLEVLASDPGSMSDIAGWAETADDVDLLDQVEADEGGEAVYKHYLSKTA
jgi:tRNA 2-thiouridine synthesizing protein A